MIRGSFKQFLVASEGRAVVLPIGDDAIEGISWDSRECTKNCAFLAMPGERVDGNDFAVQAVQSGARLVIGTRQPDAAQRAILAELGAGFIMVPDGAAALRKLAASYREALHQATVLGITGSCGKTTSKDMVSAVLRSSFKTTSTVGNRNNELGVPATLLQADLDTQALVVEIGMRGQGQIRDIASYVKPDIALITNVGVSHLELLGSRENIARAKGEMLEALPSDGCAILKSEDEYSDFILELYDPQGQRQQLFYGFDQRSQIKGSNLVLDDKGCASFDVSLPDGQEAHLHLAIPGSHNAHNALGAIAVAYRMGIALPLAVQALESLEAPAMRMQVLRRVDGLCVINDAYNANPDSMRAALISLEAMGEGRKIAVLGDMGELGPDSAGFHAELGRFVASHSIDLLLCCGELSSYMAEAALEEGMDDDAVLSFASKEEALAYLKGIVRSDDTVLVKASRSMGMEEIVKGLID